MAIVSFTSGAWVTAFNAADFSALASGAGILSSAGAVTNGSSLDLYADISFICSGSTFTPVSGGNLAFYILPLLHDGVSYPTAGSGTVAASGAQITYCKGVMAFGAVASGHSGMLTNLTVPAGTFKWYVVNRTGAALPTNTTGMTASYRLYGESVI